VDASGNVFVADEGTGYSGSAVYKIPPGCVTSSCVITLGGGFTFFEPAGVAVDGNGNVFVADLFGPVYEIPASGSVKTFNYGFSIPQGVAVDGSGNIFVADTGNNAVKEIPAGCTSSSCVKSLGGGFSYPDGVAVDGNGNVFVADTDNNILKEIPSNCVTSTCVKPMGTGFFEPYGLAVDASGNIFSGFSSSSTLVKLYPGVVDFGTLAVGKTSTAIPLTFTFDSAGTIGWSLWSTDFVSNGAGTCKGNTFFTAGSTCTFDITFSPQAAGLRTAALSLTDTSGTTIATANMQGTGTGTVGTISTTTNLVSSLNPSSYGQTVIFTVTVVATSGTATPTGTVQFSVDGSAVGTAITLSGGSGTGTTSTLASGTHSIGAAYTPSTGSAFIASNATPLSQVVNKVAPGVTVSPASSSITTAQSLSVAVTVNGGSGNATPTGTVTLSGGGYTSPATVLSSGSTTIIIPAGSLTVGADTLTASYAPDTNSTARYTTATASALVTVTNSTKTSPAVTAIPSSSTITTAQVLTVAVSVAGTPTPTGTVQLSSFGYTSAAVSLVGGNASIIIPAGSLTSGGYTMTVTYTPDSNSTSTYNTSSGSFTITVTNPVKTTPVVSVTPSSLSITTAQALSVTVAVGGSPTPTGTVTLTGGGYTSAATTLAGGSATINIPAGSLSTGSDMLTANYTPDSASSSIYNNASGTTSVTVSIPATGGGPRLNFLPGTQSALGVSLRASPFFS
jgi:hypothetical protein